MRMKKPIHDSSKSPEELDAQTKEYENMLQDFEEDSKTQDFSIPEEWDRNFRQVMDDTLKIRAKRKWIRRLEKVACLLLVVGVSANLLTTRVQGTSFMDYFKNTLSVPKLDFEVLGTSEQTEFADEDIDTDIHYEGETLDELFQNIHNDRKSPMFYITDIFDEYEVIEAQYNHEFQFLNISLQTKKGYIYIVEEFLYDNAGLGSFHGQKPIAIVNNDYLSQKINIYDNAENPEYENYYFMVVLNQTAFIFNGNITLEECKTVAQSLYFE